MFQLNSAIARFFFAPGTAASAGIGLWQWLVCRRFALDGNDWDPGFAPPVTILKTLTGCEPGTRECLESWIRGGRLRAEQEPWRRVGIRFMAG